ncbi:hypothetical protein GLAREA_04127 [Glarea lozoyensis ATCC 20868]|uniref:Heterokaryon incompatibility domain-containing protein n=1 Tax=Glarea lozoyensis (strain ATCC 20868 / MF5171) TaxID=1116229 RepID=S3CZX5_GLAL2|nr:uncharacterized protein GLAREA_04127 [Glarea lozoyensis ATCC 20868]EPE31160.1 hypothetical protein GLAREA_04127 [Glarea lozoyensis ATCC 20868]
MSYLCQDCSKFFRHWGKLQRIGFKSDLNSSRDVADIFVHGKEGCELCSIIRAYIPDEVKSMWSRTRSLQPFRLSVDMKGMEVGGAKLHVIKLEFGVGLVEICAVPVLHQLSIIKRSEVSSRNDSEHSLGQAHSWITACINGHKCQDMSIKAFPKRYVPTRLVCVRDSNDPYLCLANELPREVQYVTLSHCWGTAAQFTLTKVNLKTLRKRIPLKLLSKTFKQACFLARRFGFDYLWIDSLCIIQDDDYDWQIESSTMASVYGCSSLNIAASYARDGTVGCFVERNPEDVVPCQVSIGEQGHQQQIVCIPAEFYRRGLLGTSLGQRAWAFQERILAPRTLYFSEFQIFWGCQQLEACESFPNSIPPAVRMDINFRPHDSGNANNPTMHDVLTNSPGIWSDTVLSYSNGLLTRQEDKLVAISGVARLMQQVNKSEYLAGLWRENVEWQLLWSANSEPREWQATSKTKMINRPYRAPSWSWASTDGVIRQLFPDPTPNGTKGYQLCIQVSEAHVQPMNYSDKLGGTVDGWMKILSCGLRRVWRNRLTTWKNTIIVEKSDLSDNEDRSDFELEAVWDRPESLEEGKDLFYLPVWLNKTPYDQDKNIRRAGGLILSEFSTERRFGNTQPTTWYRRVGRATLEHKFHVSSMIVETSPKKFAFLQAHYNCPHKTRDETIFLV